AASGLCAAIASAGRRTSSLACNAPALELSGLIQSPLLQSGRRGGQALHPIADVVLGPRLREAQKSKPSLGAAPRQYAFTPRASRARARRRLGRCLGQQAVTSGADIPRSAGRVA